MKGKDFKPGGVRQERMPRAASRAMTPEIGFENDVNVFGRLGTLGYPFVKKAETVIKEFGDSNISKVLSKPKVDGWRRVTMERKLVRPQTMDEALSQREQHGNDALPSGGQSLLVMLRNKLIDPKVLLDSNSANCAACSGKGRPFRSAP